MEFLKSKISFDAAGYYLLGVLLLVLIGFWPSYFAQFFDGTLDYSNYYHFHAVIVLLWMAVLITQPILIRNKKFAIHRVIGKSTYLLFPLIIVSVVLLTHSRIPYNDGDLAANLFVPFKDLFTLSVAYGIAIYFRHNIEIHARGMIATGIIFIEPALARFSFRIFGSASFDSTPYILTVCFMYVVLIILIVAERKRKSGRWVFPLILVLLILVHSMRIFNIRLGFWESFVNWFAALPLT
ncbi:MAG TPA: hypothetical protein VLA03_07895 [Draconibacterium sp.]|nr:hypothetical protein [Draconibacterium sp.]